MPNYSKQGKILEPITLEDLENALDNMTLEYQAYAVFLFYTGVRVSEALRLVKEDFRFTDGCLYVEIGIRLKTARKQPDGTKSKGKKTAPLPIALDQPHVEILERWIKRHTKQGQRIFRFNRVSAWRHINKAGLGYNHLARLSAITSFLDAGYTVPQVIGWFGVRVETVNSYIGLKDLKKMGELKR